ncbi:MAG TPA: cell division protein FtsB [Gammaproteobacteria bacterium]|nr:cell division protein FtsB [Gammaproteobacteria bacterium]
MFTNDLAVRVAYCVLTLLLLVLQYNLWIGDGSIANVMSLQRAIEAQKQENEKLRERNLALDAEVKDLKTASDAIEERARLELGMIREGETFYRVIEPEIPTRE